MTSVYEVLLIGLHYLDNHKTVQILLSKTQALKKKIKVL